MISRILTARFILLERRRAINVRLPNAQKIQIRSVQDHDLGGHRGSPLFVSMRRCSRAFSVPIESERGSISFFDAFSRREPVSTSLENALAAKPFCREF